MKEISFDEMKQISLSKLILINIDIGLDIQVDYNSSRHIPIFVFIDKRHKLGMPDENTLIKIISKELDEPIKSYSTGYEQEEIDNIDPQINNNRLSSFSGINSFSMKFRHTDIAGFPPFNREIRESIPNEFYLLKYNFENNELEMFISKNINSYDLVTYFISKYYKNESLKEKRKEFKKANAKVKELYKQISKLNKEDKTALLDFVDSFDNK